MPNRSVQRLFRFQQTWRDSGFVALAAPCLDSGDAQAFAHQHHKASALHWGMAWCAGECSEEKDQGEDSGAASAVMGAITTGGYDQVIVVVQRWLLATAPSGLFTSDPQTVAGTASACPPQCPPPIFQRVARACLEAAPLVDLSQTLSLSCRIHYDDVSLLHQIIQELGAELLSENYEPDGVTCQLRISGQQRAQLKHRLQHALLHSQTLTLHWHSSSTPPPATGLTSL